jgi:hypothetical protein
VDERGEVRAGVTAPHEEMTMHRRWAEQSGKLVDRAAAAVRAVLANSVSGAEVKGSACPARYGLVI